MQGEPCRLLPELRLPGLVGGPSWGLGETPRTAASELWAGKCWADAGPLATLMLGPCWGHQAVGTSTKDQTLATSQAGACACLSVCAEGVCAEGACAMHGGARALASVPGARALSCSS